MAYFFCILFDKSPSRNFETKQRPVCKYDCQVCILSFHLGFLTHGVSGI